jgi:hypothetical protein
MSVHRPRGRPSVRTLRAGPVPSPVATRGGAVRSARRAHNPEVAGSNPAPATRKPPFWAVFLFPAVVPFLVGAVWVPFFRAATKAGCRSAMGSRSPGCSTRGSTGPVARGVVVRVRVEGPGLVPWLAPRRAAARRSWRGGVMVQERVLAADDVVGDVVAGRARSWDGRTGVRSCVEGAWLGGIGQRLAAGGD